VVILVPSAGIAQTPPMLRSARLRAWVPIGALVSLHLCVLDPLEVFRANAAGFGVPFDDLLPGLAGVALAVFGVVLLVGMLVPERIHARVLAGVAALAGLAWIQSAFLVGGLDVLDGRTPDPSPWRQLDLLLWAGGLSLALRFPRPMVRLAPFTAGCLIVLWVGVALVRGVPPVEPAKTQAPDTLFEASSSRNVLQILLDSLQPDIFLEVVRERGWEEEFDGFTVYPGTIGVARWTSYALPAIFAGSVYDGSIPFNRFYGEAMEIRSFHHALADAGYRVHLVPQRLMTPRNATVHYTYSVNYGLARSDLLRRERARLLDLSLYRHAPQLLRGSIRRDGAWLLTAASPSPPTTGSFRQRAFLRDFTERLAVADATPRYHFLHLTPPHPPYVTRPDGTWAGEVLPQTRENHKVEARWILEEVIRLLRRLRGLGIWDSTTVILHGDHGSSFDPVVDGVARPMPHSRVPALLAVRRRGDNGPLRTSPAQASLLDLGATVLDEAGLDVAFPGNPVHEIPGGDRDRPFFVVDDASSERPTLTRYRVRGPAHEPGAWEELATVAIARADRSYPWGHTVHFGTTGDADPFRGIGWSAPSNTAEWTDGPEAELHFDLPPVTSDLHLYLMLQGYVDPQRLPRQRIRILANGHEISQSEITVPDALEANLRIPQDVFGDSNSLTLRFEMPDATSPQSIGASGDARELGIFLWRVRIEPI